MRSGGVLWRVEFGLVSHGLMQIGTAERTLLEFSLQAAQFGPVVRCHGAMTTSTIAASRNHPQ